MKSYRNNHLKVLLLILCITFIFTACESNNDSGTTATVLKVVNQYDSKSIKSVTLVGYEFSNLLITYGNSQTFTLDKGFSSGYNNINVTVTYGSGGATWYINNQFNFNEGDITTITLKGSDSEGAPYYNNTCLE